MYDCRIYTCVTMTNYAHLLFAPMVVHGILKMMPALG